MSDHNDDVETESDDVSDPTSGVTYIKLEGVNAEWLGDMATSDELAQNEASILQTVDEECALPVENVEIITHPEITENLRAAESVRIMKNGGVSVSSLSSTMNMRVNDLLAEDGNIGSMQTTGGVGYHVNPATGETYPGSLWKVAFLQALDEMLLDEVTVRDAEVEDAVETLARGISDEFHPRTREYLVEAFETNLRGLIDTERELADKRGEYSDEIGDDRSIEEFADELDDSETEADE